MPSLDELSYNLLNLFRGGRSSNNEHISLPQIKFSIVYYRALFIRRDMQRIQRVDPFTQDLGNLKVARKDPSDGLGLPKTLRTDSPIPTPVRLKARSGLTYVGAVDKTTSFPIIDDRRAGWTDHSKYTAGAKRAFYRGGYVWVIGDTLLDWINVRGIFEDPRQVPGFDDKHSDFPISGDMSQRITQALIKGEMQLVSQSRTDLTADMAPDDDQPTPAGG